MKKSYKLILINVTIALVISMVFGLTYHDGEVFMMSLGTVDALLGILCLFIGVIVIAASTKERSKEWGQAFLISGGVLFLLGVGICGSMFMFL